MFSKKQKKAKKIRGYSTAYYEYPTDNGKLIITDNDVAKYVKKHTYWWQRLDYHFVCDCASASFDVLIGCIDPPKKKNFKWGIDRRPDVLNED